MTLECCIVLSWSLVPKHYPNKIKSVSLLVCVDASSEGTQPSVAPWRVNTSIPSWRMLKSNYQYFHPLSKLTMYKMLNVCKDHLQTMTVQSTFGDSADHDLEYSCKTWIGYKRVSTLSFLLCAASAVSLPTDYRC